MRKPKGESVARALVRAVESLSSLEPGSALEPESSCRWWDGLPSLVLADSAPEAVCHDESSLDARDGLAVSAEW